jgi:ABC-type lipoprotein release transport system permease subunit
MRYKRRTILTFIILSVGIALYIVMVGFVQGYKKLSIENFINFDTGHFKIRSADYDEDAPFSVSNFITNFNQIESVLKGKKYIKAYTERIKFMAELDNGIDSVPCEIIGIDPVKDPAVFSLTNSITTGKLEYGGSLIGLSLADDLGLKPGDSVYMTFRNGQGVFDSIELAVSGLVNSADPVVNNSTLFININEAEKYLNIPGVSEISVKVDDLNKDGEYIKDLKKDITGSQIVSWRKLSESIAAASEQDEATTYIFVVFIAIIAIVGIINTMLMSVFEKTKEIGTLKALGMTDGDVRILFVMEGAIIGILGGLMGLMLGCLINGYFSVAGYDLTAMIGKENQDLMSAFRLMGVLRSTWDIPSIITAFVLSVVSSILASYYPARKTTQLQPAECLRTI